jgi:hypothetical protein
MFMQQSAHSEIIAAIKSAAHIWAALVIVWCFYRIANGHFSLL